MKLLILLAVVAVPFGLFWLGLRRTQPRGDGPGENAREALRMELHGGGPDPEPSHEDE